MVGMAGELRSVLRRLATSPGFTLVSVLTLALGIGANVAIFSLVNGILLRQLPYPQAERLIVVSHAAPGFNLDQMNISEPLYLHYREQARSFDGMGLYRGGRVSLTGLDVPDRISSGTVTASLFQVLQASPVRGRIFAAEDEAPGATPVALIGEAMWRDRFGSAADVVGRTIELDSVAREVIGVMPADFQFPDVETEVWLPLQIDPETTQLGAFGVGCLARLKDGVAREAALADLQRFTNNLAEEFPEEGAAPVLANAGFFPILTPFLDEVVGDFRQILWILLGSVAFVLLMACANVANLFLVRAEGRHREIAIKSALGAGQGRVAGSFLLEGILLSLAGGAASLLLARLAIRGLVALAPAGIPRLGEVEIDAPVLLFALAASLFSALLFALLPALQHGGSNLVASLKEGARGSGLGRVRLRTRHALVVLQIALGLVLLIGAGLMVRSFLHLSRVEPGFDPQTALTLRLSLPATAYDTAESRARFVDAAQLRLASLPGVAAVAATNQLPLSGSMSGSGYALEDFPLQENDLPPVFRVKEVSPGYFKTMGIPLVAGRGIEPQDHQNRTGSVVISESLAKKYWPEASALGKRLRPGQADPENWYTVVGVAGDVHEQNLRTEPPDLVYHPMVGLEGDGGIGQDASLILRTTNHPKSSTDAVRAEVWALDRNIPITQVMTLEELVERAQARMGFSMLLLLVAAGLALGLGTIGIYSVVSYLVSERTQEIGVRLALGAQGGQVRGMVVKDGLAVALGGVLVGLGGAFALTRLMRALLFGIGPLDPLTFTFVPVILIAISLLACLLPALRASRVDPLVALRYE